MIDYFATQRTGTVCAPRNCAAASGAMGLAAGSANAITLTSDEFRAEANVSCIPGQHSNSGGLFIGDVIRVFEAHGVEIDYGQFDDPPGFTRWAPSELARRLESDEEGAVLLGDYDALPKQFRASFTFLGDHSAWVHDYRASDKSICWHDPLRFKPIRIPISAALSYWQKPGSPVRGFAGFVSIKEANVPGLALDHLKSKPGTVVVKNIQGVLAVQVADLQSFALAPGSRKTTIGSARLIGDPLGQDGDDGVADRHTVYIVGQEAAVVLAEQVTFKEFEA